MVTELFYFSPAVSGVAFDAPLLIIHGTDDQLVDPNDSVAFVKNHKRSNVDLLLLDGCGHGLEAKADDVYEHTLSFFKRCC